MSTQEDINQLRSDLVLLGKWSTDWLMLFNINKCNVMQVGTNNPLVSYSLCGKTLNCVDEEKDLGVIMSGDLKISKQCVTVVKTANRILI